MREDGVGHCLGAGSPLGKDAGAAGQPEHIVSAHLPFGDDGGNRSADPVCFLLFIQVIQHEACT